MHWTKNLLIWAKLFIWEDLGLWLFKISTGMQDEKAWYAFHSIAEMVWHHSCVVIATEWVRLGWPGNVTWGNLFYKFEVLVAMVTELCTHTISAMVWTLYHVSESFILQTSANFKKSKMQIFSNKEYFSNQIILCYWLFDRDGRERDRGADQIERNSRQTERRTEESETRNATEKCWRRSSKWSQSLFTLLSNLANTIWLNWTWLTFINKPQHDKTN